MLVPSGCTAWPLPTGSEQILPVGGPPLHARQAPVANALAVGDGVYLFDVRTRVLRQMDAARL